MGSPGGADYEGVEYAVANDCVRKLSGPEFGQGLRAALQLTHEPEVEPAEDGDACTIPAGTTAPELISPELALVCPELRKSAIEGLPDRDPDGFLPPRRQPCEGDIGPYLVETDCNVSTRRRRGSHLTVAAAACVAVEAMRMAVFAVVTIGGVAGLVTFATVLPGA